jgi:hypothetical protein
MISSISSSPIHKIPELVAFHKPQQPLSLDLATRHKPSMATQDPTNDFTAAIQPLLEDLTLADPQPNFTLFPKLPPELRLKILKYALPVGHKGRRFIRVKARIGAPSSRSKEPCWFIVENNACSSDVKDIGLLGVNREFRHMYLRHFDKTLTAKGVGLIRYHENDIIFICKYSCGRFRSLFSLATSSTFLFVIGRDSTDSFVLFSQHRQTHAEQIDARRHQSRLSNRGSLQFLHQHCSPRKVRH